MTDLLQKAFHEASRLSPHEQDHFATWMLHEILSERRWNDLFARSPELLERMASEAIAEHEAGITQPLDPDKL